MRSILAPLLACASITLMALPAHGEYPDRPIRMVVNSLPGGGGDILARVLAPELAAKLGQGVVIDNRPGAGGNIAGELIARAAPDGYTLMMADSGPLVVNISLYPKMSFDPLRDFAPVARVGSVPILVLVHPSLGANSFADLVAKAKAAPGTIAYASPGTGSTQHLAAELLWSQVGIKLSHVPYKAAASALTDLIAGHALVGIIGVPPAAQHVRSGAVTALAITTMQRSPLLPDVPTLVELGVARYQAVVWFGLVAPRATPPTVVATLNRVVNDVLAIPAVRTRLTELGYAIDPGTPAELERYMQEETLRWRKAVEVSGAKNE